MIRTDQPRFIGHTRSEPNRIGIVRKRYPELRNFAYVDDTLLQFCLTRDAFDWLRKIWHRLSGVGYSLFLHSFAFPLGDKPSLYHCFNSICLGHQAWIVTFETTLPRCTAMPAWLLKFSWLRLASDQCCAIIALSNCSQRIFLEDLASNRAQLSENMRQKIREKTKVLHPPQPLLIKDLNKEALVSFDLPLRLAFVGHDFFRKGGLELLMVVHDLLAAGFELQLAIVSKMVAGDYASRAGSDEIAQAKAIIQRYPDKVTVENMLANDDVFRLLKQSHIVCLPTWGETYGYSVLEGQSAGCPAITTNLRALPEINNSECGWVIEVPKLANGDGDIDTPKKRKVFRKILLAGVRKALLEALSDREALRKKSYLSLKRIREHHSPIAHQASLLRIYSDM